MEGKKYFFFRVIKVFFGTFLISIGISMLVTGNYGVDTISTLLLGIMNYLSIPFWLASMSFNILVLLLVGIVDKKELGIGSIINAVGIGVMIRYLSPIFAHLSETLPNYSMVVAFIGPLLFGVGGAIYVSANLGAAALEALTNILCKKTKLSIKVIRIILDASLVISGLLLGATVGLGTIMCVLLIGPSLEFTYRILTKKEREIVKNTIM